MIYGVGTDLVNVARVESLLRRFGERFVNRILCQTEVAEYGQAPQPAHFLAKRFAAKEAFSKALGTGIGEKMGWHDIHLTHDQWGRPIIKSSPALAQYLASLQIDASYVSLSDEQDYALAFVILEKQ